MIGGDQLTEERIYNAQKGFLDGRNQYEQLKGLLPKCEDWHLKRTIYEVSTNNYLQLWDMLKIMSKTLKNVTNSIHM